ncbi:SLAM family member 6 [Poecilia reticulata]|uniref:SLAM family member 6 n=1 Tax=Poecilia reticulata TaxID=8081 RepID=UPI0004A4A9A8|nr:PREDICTED: SLAM family member 6 [Poecilia reticulata]
MAAVVLLLLLPALVDSIEGSELRFVKSGSNLLLEAKTDDIVNDDIFFWKFNNSDVLVTFIPPREPKIKYTERTDFFQQNYSLLLRNVQHNNTGNYKATATGNIEKTVGEYTVIVQDPVSPVNLTVTCIDRRFNNFTATCRTADSQINGTFQCNNITCRLLNQTHLKDSSLKIYLEESLITCNHSNNVSQEKSVKNVSSLCENLPVTSTATIVGGSVGAFVLLVSSIICFVVIKCKRKRSANTVYEVPQEPPQHNPYANPTEMTECPSPTSTYALVQFSNPPVQLNETRTSTTPQPETIYAQVDRAAKSKSNPAAANR